MRAEDEAGAAGPYAVLLGHTPGELWQQEEVLWAPRRDAHLLVAGAKEEDADAVLEGVLAHAACYPNNYEPFYFDLRRILEEDTHPPYEATPPGAYRALSLEMALREMESLRSAVDQIRAELRDRGLRDRGELEDALADEGMEREGRRFLVCVREAANFAPSVRDERSVSNAKQHFRRRLARVLEWGASTGVHVVATLTRDRAKNFVPPTTKAEFTAHLLLPGLGRERWLRACGPWAAYLSRTGREKSAWHARGSGFFPEVEVPRVGPAGPGEPNA